MPNDLSPLAALNALINEIPQDQFSQQTNGNSFNSASPFFVVKDNIHVAGIANTAGNTFFKKLYSPLKTALLCNALSMLGQVLLLKPICMN